MSKLDQLLERIQRHPKDVEAVCKKVLSNFTPSREVTEPEDLKRVLGEFHCKAHNLYLNRKRSFQMDFDFPQAIFSLESEFGPSAFKKSFHMAMSGENGGLYGVLNVLAEGLADSWAKRGVEVLVTQYMNSVKSYEQRKEAATEYLSKYAHILPSELHNVRTVVDFERILNIHPFLISKTMDIRG